MKLTKTTYHLLLRFLAGFIASLIMVSAVALIPQPSKSLFRTAAGVDPKSTVMTIDGQSVDAESYLYWLSYYCNYYHQYLGYMGVTDLGTELGEGFTAGDYIAQQADMQTMSMLIQHAMVDEWAQEADVSLTEEDLLDIESQREQTVAQFGSEAAYQEQLHLLGVNEDFITRTLSYSYLTAHLQEAYCDPQNALYPGAEEIRAYAEANDYLGAFILFIDTCEMDETQKADTKKEMEGYAASLREAEDVDATFAELAEKLGMLFTPLTFAAGAMEPAFVDALKQISVGDVSGVIATDEGSYVAIRQEPASDEIVLGMLNETFSARCANAEVTFNDSVYGAINTLDFYQNFLAAQSALIQ